MPRWLLLAAALFGSCHGVRITYDKLSDTLSKHGGLSLHLQDAMAASSSTDNSYDLFCCNFDEAEEKCSNPGKGKTTRRPCDNMRGMECRRERYMLWNKNKCRCKAGRFYHAKEEKCGTTKWVEVWTARWSLLAQFSDEFETLSDKFIMRTLRSNVKETSISKSKSIYISSSVMDEVRAKLENEAKLVGSPALRSAKDDTTHICDAMCAIPKITLSAADTETLQDASPSTYSKAVHKYFSTLSPAKEDCGDELWESFRRDWMRDGLDGWRYNLEGAQIGLCWTCRNAVTDLDLFQDIFQICPKNIFQTLQVAAGNFASIVISQIAQRRKRRKEDRKQDKIDDAKNAVLEEEQASKYVASWSDDKLRRIRCRAIKNWERGLSKADWNLMSSEEKQRKMWWDNASGVQKRAEEAHQDADDEHTATFYENNPRPPSYYNPNNPMHNPALLASTRDPCLTAPECDCQSIFRNDTRFTGWRSY